jgi:hypothetical protein
MHQRMKKHLVRHVHTKHNLSPFFNHHVYAGPSPGGSQDGLECVVYELDAAIQRPHLIKPHSQPATGVDGIFAGTVRILEGNRRLAHVANPDLRKFGSRSNRGDYRY